MESSTTPMRTPKRGLWLVVALGVLLLLAGALVWRSQTVAKAQFALEQASVLLENPTPQNAAQALPLLDEAARLAPQMVEVYIQRAFAYQSLGEYEKVAAASSKAIELEPENVWAHNAYADALNTTKQYRRALKVSERAIALAPNNPSGYFNYGVASRHLKMYPQALRAFDQCIAISPRVAEPYLERARSLRLQGHHKRAFEACSAAIRYGKGALLVDAYITRGNASASQNQFHKAIADYDTAILIDPQYASGFFNRGLAYRQLKKMDAALKNFNRAIALDKNYTHPYYFRAQIWMQRNEWKKAVADSSRVLQLDSNYDRARKLRIWANYRLGDAEAVVRDCNFLIHKKQNVAYAYAIRGLARLLQFRDADARRDFEKSHQQAAIEVPENPDVGWKALMQEAARTKARRKKNKTKP